MWDWRPPGFRPAMAPIVAIASWIEMERLLAGKWVALDVEPRMAQRGPLQSAASRQATRCPTHPRSPNDNIQRMPERINCRRAENIRPCANCPRPGKNRLARAAITFPPDPRPLKIARIKTPAFSKTTQRFAHFLKSISSRAAS